MLIKEKIEHLIEKSLNKLGVPKGMVEIKLDHPTDPKFGDYSTNVAMVLVRHMGAATKKPLDLAKTLAEEMQKEIEGLSEFPISKIDFAPPGFINFYLSDSFIREAINEVLEKTVWFGKNTRLWNKKIIIEHTNLNPFKPFHIGHLVNNAVGESISRLLEFQDVKLTRASYGGDVGMHVAKTLWGLIHSETKLTDSATLDEQIDFIGKAYAFGASSFEVSESSKTDIQDINKKIYSRSDEQINTIYDWGKKISLEYFQTIYRKLHTRFDVSFLESEVADEGAQLVKKGQEKGVFKESEGAIIFPGEEYGLHNRVFISSQGLPTYEAKEVGLTKRKFELQNFDESIIITASEQNDYFKVVIKAIEQLYPEIANRTKHISHGMMRFASGKMSSRKGNVVTGESLLSDVQEMIQEKMKEQNFSESEKKEIAEKVAIGAIKYSILKQTIGKDIIFDPEKSISFEGDSGPYLQYTYVRTRSLLAKAKEEGIKPKKDVKKQKGEASSLEKKMYVFPEIVERAADELSPNYIVTYLTELAGEFNSYYATHKIVDSKDSESAYRLALTEATGWILKNGLWLLGIETPEKM